MSLKPGRATASTIPRGPRTSAAATPLVKRRTFLLTGAVTLIASVGAIIGASLKSKQQAARKEVAQKQVELSTSDQIALLEASRSQLVAKKMLFEEKIAQLRGRQKKTAEKEREKQLMTAGGDDSVQR